MARALGSPPAVAAWLAAALALALALAALPLASASHLPIGEEIPQASEQLVAAANPPAPAPELPPLELPPLDAPTGGKQGEEIPTPAAQLLVVVMPGNEEAASAPAPAAEAGLLGPLGAAKSGGGLGSDEAGLLGSDAGGADAGLGAGATPVAMGGTEYDLVGTLFNGNSAAFTAAVLASGEGHSTTSA